MGSTLEFSSDGLLNYVIPNIKEAIQQLEQARVKLQTIDVVPEIQSTASLKEYGENTISKMILDLESVNTFIANKVEAFDKAQQNSDLKFKKVDVSSARNSKLLVFSGYGSSSNSNSYNDALNAAAHQASNATAAQQTGRSQSDIDAAEAAEAAARAAREAAEAAERERQRKLKEAEEQAKKAMNDLLGQSASISAGMDAANRAASATIAAQQTGRTVEQVQTDMEIADLKRKAKDYEDDGKYGAANAIWNRVNGLTESSGGTSNVEVRKGDTQTDSGERKIVINIDQPEAPGVQETTETRTITNGGDTSNYIKNKRQEIENLERQKKEAKDKQEVIELEKKIDALKKELASQITKDIKNNTTSSLNGITSKDKEDKAKELKVPTSVIDNALNKLDYIPEQYKKDALNDLNTKDEVFQQARIEEFRNAREKYHNQYGTLASFNESTQELTQEFSEAWLDQLDAQQIVNGYRNHGNATEAAMWQKIIDENNNPNMTYGEIKGKLQEKYRRDPATLDWNLILQYEKIISAQTTANNMGKAAEKWASETSTGELNGVLTSNQNIENMANIKEEWERIQKYNGKSTITYGAQGVTDKFYTQSVDQVIKDLEEAGKYETANKLRNTYKKAYINDKVGGDKDNYKSEIDTVKVSEVTGVVFSDKYNKAISDARDAWKSIDGNDNITDFYDSDVETVINELKKNGKDTEAKALENAYSAAYRHGKVGENSTYEASYLGTNGYEPAKNGSTKPKNLGTNGYEPAANGRTYEYEKKEGLVDRLNELGIEASMDDNYEDLTYKAKHSKAYVAQIGKDYSEVNDILTEIDKTSKGYVQNEAKYGKENAELMYKYGITGDSPEEILKNVREDLERCGPIKYSELIKLNDYFRDITGGTASDKKTNTKQQETNGNKNQKENKNTSETTNNPIELTNADKALLEKYNINLEYTAYTYEQIDKAKRENREDAEALTILERKFMANWTANTTKQGSNGALTTKEKLKEMGVDINGSIKDINEDIDEKIATADATTKQELTRLKNELNKERSNNSTGTGTSNAEIQEGPVSAEKQLQALGVNTSSGNMETINRNIDTAISLAQDTKTKEKLENLRNSLNGEMHYDYKNKTDNKPNNKTDKKPDNKTDSKIDNPLGNSLNNITQADIDKKLDELAKNGVDIDVKDLEEILKDVPDEHKKSALNSLTKEGVVKSKLLKSVEDNKNAWSSVIRNFPDLDIDYDNTVVAGDKVYSSSMYVVGEGDNTKVYLSLDQMKVHNLIFDNKIWEKQGEDDGTCTDGSTTVIMIGNGDITSQEEIARLMRRIEDENENNNFFAARCDGNIFLTFIESGYTVEGYTINNTTAKDKENIIKHMKGGEAVSFGLTKGTLTVYNEKGEKLDTRANINHQIALIDIKEDGNGKYKVLVIDTSGKEGWADLDELIDKNNNGRTSYMLISKNDEKNSESVLYSSVPLRDENGDIDETKRSSDIYLKTDSSKNQEFVYMDSGHGVINKNLTQHTESYKEYIANNVKEEDKAFFNKMEKTLKDNGIEIKEGDNITTVIEKYSKCIENDKNRKEVLTDELHEVLLNNYMTYNDLETLNEKVNFTNNLEGCKEVFGGERKNLLLEDCGYTGLKTSQSSMVEVAKLKGLTEEQARSFNEYLSNNLVDANINEYDKVARNEKEFIITEESNNYVDQLINDWKNGSGITATTTNSNSENNNSQGNNGTASSEDSTPYIKRYE